MGAHDLVLDTETRERSGEQERQAILAALVEVVAERGCSDTTVELVLEQAGLVRAAFDRHFRDKHGCLLAAWQEQNESCMRGMLEAYNSEERWPDRLRALVCEVVSGICREPSRGSLAIEVLAVGDAARARRDMTMRVVASLIDAGRNEMEDPESVPHTTAEALAGAAYGQIYSRVVRGCVEGYRPLLAPRSLVSELPGFKARFVAMKMRADRDAKRAERLLRELGAASRSQ